MTKQPTHETSAFELIAAPHTPFAANGDLSLVPIARQADHLRQTGVTGVLIAGSTGEGPSLTMDERRRLTDQWVEVGRGLRVIIHVGSACVRDAAALAKHAAAAGAGAICAAPPSWFPIDDQDVLVDTCAEIAQGASGLPFFYYHIPALSGVELTMAPFLERVRAKVPSFAGIKYTHLDVVDFGECVRDHGDAIKMWWGCDEALLIGLGAGAHGAVGSSYNFAAPIYLKLVAAYRSGELELADTLQKQSVVLIDQLAARGYPSASKLMMRLLGIDCGPTRLPQATMAASAELRLRADLERIGFFDWIAG